MNQTKSALASSGVWGGIIAMAAPIIGQLSEIMGASPHPALQIAGTIMGGLMSIYGRVAATAGITGVFKK